MMNPHSRPHLLRLSALLLSFALPFALGCEEEPKPLTLTVEAAEEPTLTHPLTLTATLSADISEVSWRVLEQPPGRGASLSPLTLDPREPQIAHATLTPSALGLHLIEVETKSGGRTSREELSVEVRCAPPMWQVTLSPEGEAPTRVGRDVVVLSSLSAPPQEGCPEVEPPQADFEWSLRSWPSALSPQAIEGALTPIDINRATLRPTSRGVYLAHLTLTDALARTSEASLSVEVSCGEATPVASAEVLSGATLVGDQLEASVGIPVVVALSGQEGAEACADDPSVTLPPLSYAWSWARRPAGSRATLSDRGQGQAEFNPDLPGLYELQGVVTSAEGLSATATLSFNVGVCNTRAPLITSLNANPARLDLGEASQLSLAWLDPDQEEGCVTPLGSTSSEHHVAWRVVSAPAESSAQPIPSASFTPTFTPDREGLYTLEVTLTDATDRSASASVELEVRRCALRPLTLSTSSPLNALNLYDVATMSAFGALSEPEEGCGEAEESLPVLTYTWRTLVSPAGALALPYTDRPSVSWVARVAGEYLFEVTVSDPTALRAPVSERVAVSVTACGESAPIINNISAEGALAIGESVRLSAEVSDPDQACAPEGDVEYLWRVVSRPAESLASFTEAQASSARPTLTFDRSGEYIVELTARDEVGLEDQERLTLTVSTCGEAAPTLEVSASEERPLLGQWVTLSAVASDADASPECDRPASFTYHWRAEALPLGYEPALNLTGARPSLFIERAGLYQLSVYVTDETGLSSPTQLISINAQPCGLSAPVVEALNASPAQAQLGAPVRLSAEVSDPDASCGLDLSATATLRWQLSSAPSTSRAALSDSPTPTLTPDVPGEYVVRVTAQTSDGLISAPVERTLTVSGCGGFSPIISDLSATPSSTRVGEVVSLSVTSDDADREAPCALSDEHSVVWRVVSAPAGSSATVMNPTQASASFTPDLEGEYQLEVRVTDSRGLQARALTSLTAASCGRVSPTLNPINVSNNSPFVGEVVTLSAQAIPPDATCEDDQSLSWRWRVIARPVGSTAALSSDGSSEGSSESSPTPSFTPDLPGTYRFEALVESAGGVISAPQTLSLTARSCGLTAPSISALTPPVEPPEGFNVGERLSVSVAGDNPNASCSPAGEVRAQWTLSEAPAGSAARLINDSPLSTSLTPDLAGRYTFEVRLIDAVYGLSSPLDRVSVVVGACGSEPPEALVGSTAPHLAEPVASLSLQTYTCQDSPFVQLDASASQDSNLNTCGLGGELAYQWSVREVTPGLSVSVAAPDREAVNLSVSGLAPQQTGSTRLEVEVSNALGLSDRAEVELLTTRLNAPDAQAVSPDFFCVGERTVTLTGQDFFEVAGVLPTVLFGELELPAVAARGCVQVDQSDIRACNELDVTVPAGLNADLYAVSVRNPYPLACSDEGAKPTVLLISAPRVERSAPSPLCRGQFTGEITLTGSGFLSEEGGGASATLTVNGEQVAERLAGCVNAGNQLLTCSEVSFNLPASQRDVSDLTLTLTNPPTSGCAPEDLSATFVLTQSEPPLINDITPRKICDQGGALTLLGDHFEPGMTVDLGPYRADEVQNINGEQEAEARWARQAEPRFVPGEYLVTARNDSGCEETFPDPILVTEGPVPFFVDPPVVYSGVSLQATAYLGNLFGGSVSRAEIQQGANPPIELEFSDDPNKPSLIRLVLPAGLPDGLYDLTLYDDVNCPGTTPALLRITSDLSVVITEVTPPFAWSESATSITAFADPNAGFVPTPRSYLSPSPSNECAVDAECGAGLCRLGRCVDRCVETPECAQGEACVGGACVAQASELRAASLSSLTELKGVVAQGFSPGEYDLIVVNPDGSVGLLERAIKVNADPPPEVKAVSPGSWEVNNAALPIQISGAHFRDVALSVTCVDSGVSTPASITLVSQTDQLINATLDTSNLSVTQVCSLRVTNSDSAYDDLSPLTLTNPSGNFVSFNLSPAMPANDARRLSAVTVAKVPNGPSKLYVFGGDKGSDAQALNDNLVIGIDALGNLQSWQTLPTTLPHRLTNIEAHTVGRFIYIMGGFNADTNSASADVLRAELLDPLYVPVIDQVDFEFDPEIAGLNTGIYYYRIAAVYGALDPNNPNGESLPSEPQPVFVPDIPVGVRLKLTWLGLPDAVGYRVYRSPTPNLLFGEEELVAELGAGVLTWYDEGVSPLSTKRTLTIGELGEWSVVAQLNRARTQHATTLAPDPSDPSLYHLYAIGGVAQGAVSDDYEVISIDTSDPRGHVVGGARRVVGALSVARSQLKATRATPEEASLLPAGKTFVYAFGGLQSDNVEVAEVLAGGDLGPFNLTESMQRSRQGYFATVANNTALTICGQGGSASSTAEKGELCGVGNTGRNCDLPEYVSKWSSLGNTGVQSCVNPGGVAAGGFLYLIGGGDGTSAISSKVDVSLLGGTP